MPGYYLVQKRTERNSDNFSGFLFLGVINIGGEGYQIVEVLE
jgi:hypothetical protein